MHRGVERSPLPCLWKQGWIYWWINSETDDSDPNLLTLWIHSNNIVILWILNSVSKEIWASILFSDSAHKIWIDLQDRFQQSNGPWIFQLRRELLNHAQNQQSVNVYFTKLKALWEEMSNFRPICSCGNCTCGGVKDLIAYFQTEYVMSFFMGLNNSFTQIRGQSLLLNPIPPINKVFSRLSRMRQRNISSQTCERGMDSLNSMAFTIKVKTSSRTKRFAITS